MIDRSALSEKTIGVSLLLLLLLAFTLRMGTGLLLHYTVHNDEIFQVLEQAHRAVSGTGIIPWEFRSGIRGWLWPGFLAFLLAPVEKITGSSETDAYIVSVVCSLMSLWMVWAAFRLGALISTLHAISAGFVVAVWFEFLFFSPHPLNEVAATDFLLPGLYMLSLPTTARRLFFAGVLLGVCFVLRPHLGPSLGVAAIWAARFHLKDKWLPLLLGGLLPLLVYGAIDALTWGTPFISIYRYIVANLVEGRSTSNGSQPVYSYIKDLILHWGGTIAMLTGLIVIGARRFPIWFLTASTIVVSHSLIDHKEYRFIFPAIACYLILAGIGSADVVQWVRNRLNGQYSGRLLTIGTLVGWAITSAALATSKSVAPAWFNFTPANLAMKYAGRQASICGLGLHEVLWHDTYGPSVLQHQVPIYQDGYRTIGKPSTLDRSYNVALANPLTNLPSDFAVSKCFEAPFQNAVCVYVRPGGCSVNHDKDLNHWLVENDQ